MELKSPEAGQHRHPKNPFNRTAYGIEITS